MRAVARDDAARARRAQRATSRRRRRSRSRRPDRDDQPRDRHRQDRCRTVARMNMDLTPEQERQVFEAGVNVVVVPPSVGYHFAANYTVLDQLGGRPALRGRRLALRHPLPDPAPRGRAARPDHRRRHSRRRRSRSRSPRTSRSWRSTNSRAGRSTSRPAGRDVAQLVTGSGPSPKFLYSRFSTAMRLSIPASTRPISPRSPGAPSTTAARAASPSATATSSSRSS